MVDHGSGLGFRESKRAKQRADSRYQGCDGSAAPREWADGSTGQRLSQIKAQLKASERARTRIEWTTGQSGREPWWDVDEGEGTSETRGDKRG